MNHAKVTAGDGTFDRFYKRLRNQANRSMAAHFGTKTADAVTCVPDFVYLLCKLMGDPDVPAGRKLDMAGALLYIVSPFEILPDAVPVLGVLDDAYVTLLAVSKLIRDVDREVVLRYWLSDPRVIDNVRSWLQYLDHRFGSGLIKNIIAYVSAS